MLLKVGEKAFSRVPFSGSLFYSCLDHAIRVVFLYFSFDPHYSILRYSFFLCIYFEQWIVVRRDDFNDIANGVAFEVTSLLSFSFALIIFSVH
jgi:hypothetical protein